MQYEEKEMYLFLNFEDSLERDYFNKEKLYFNISNLQDERPFIQLDDNLFIGTYENCVGTNVFFEELEEPPTKRDIFEKETPIHLKFVTKQCRELRLQHAIKKPQRTVNVAESNVTSEPKQIIESVAVLNEEQDEENIESIAIAKDEVNVDAVKVKKQSEELLPKVDKKILVPSKKRRKKLSKLKIEEEKYYRLKLLAKEPVRFDVPEEKVEIPEDLRSNYFYRWYCNNFMQIPAAFPKINHNFNTETLEGGVDVKKCIESGLICLDNWPCVLTESEKRVLKDFNNFKNMSLPMRRLVISEKIRDLKNDKECSVGEWYIQALIRLHSDIEAKILTLENEK